MPEQPVPRHPALDALLREEFRARGIIFQETVIGGYRVFWGLSERVEPSRLGLD